MRLAFLFLSVVSAVAAQGQKPVPVYFVNSGASSAEQCETLAKGGAVQLTPVFKGLPIFVPRNQLEICIYFPGTTDPKQGTWYLHEGSGVGNCANNCCEWIPPVGNSGQAWQRPSEPKFKWYEVSGSQACTAVANFINGPIVMPGQINEAKSICLDDGTGNLVRYEGKLPYCGGGNCCTFSPDNDQTLS